MALVLYAVEIPDSVEVERWSVKDLPGDWREQPAPQKTMDLGTQWLTRNARAVLSVPSVIVPAETNLILNPAHPHFNRIKVVSREPFGFDARMW